MRSNLPVAMLRGAATAAALLLLEGFSAHAAVVESTASGFAIAQTVQIAASPDKVYAALIHPERWWNSEHTFSGSAANLLLDAKAGGCFCETMPGGGSVEHQIVVAAKPGSQLRLRGALGPFQGQGVDGALTFTLAPKDGGTMLLLENNLGGFMKGGFGPWPQRADAMLAEQMARLKLFVETNSPEPAHK